MRIKSVDETGIEFDNGKKIIDHHVSNCCENNYADFEQIEEQALSADFYENLIFESVLGGFRFGSIGTHMFFIPCYSEQNGYYSSDIDIHYDGKWVLNTNCEEINTD